MIDAKYKVSICCPKAIAAKYPTDTPKEIAKRMWDKAVAMELGHDPMPQGHDPMDVGHDLLDEILQDVCYVPSDQTRKALCAYHRQERVKNDLVIWITKRTGLRPSEEDDM
jgi:hypothetical protein